MYLCVFLILLFFNKMLMSFFIRFVHVVLSGLRKQEDSWIFEEPVTEDIAPGYFEVVNTPMDFQTVEKKMETGQYTTREQVQCT